MGDLGIAVTQSQPGAHERMLQGILGSALGSEQPPGVHPQPVSVSAYERLEGRLVTRPGELDEAIVGLTVKRPERDRRNGPADGLRAVAYT